MNDRHWTIEDHLDDKPAASIALFRRVEQEVRRLGDVRVSVSKTTVTFKGSRRGFFGARPTKTGVDGYFDIMRSLDSEDPRIRTVSPYQNNLFVHQYRLESADDLDDEFLSWLHEAYEVGNGAHLRGG
ncbi:MAG TPA: hypothetical protein H9830_05015 [Candidatus Agrococcus pullicola]|uniref:DUF5655 domain-containing protein n=1 Tax=Candidatus Agrococcus pullicola TaxID=2838429 RepID=A0A9D1YU50_9MICO|nr:hypothetical protein [Candidatus Agrococcus pullicola]